MRENQEKKLKIAIVIMILVCITLVICFQVQKYKKNHKKYANVVVENGVVASDANYDKLEKDNMKAKLLNMGERDRMEYYIAHFINCCERKKYSLAYEMLGEDFKTGYFQTEEAFEKYAKEKFPSMANLDFTNIERNGNTYVMWVTITDVLNGKRDSGIEYNFVIEENDINNIKMAFSVK